MTRQIMLCGVSGTGKSTLAQWISETIKIPFKISSTKLLWEQEGITCHLDIQKRTIKDPEWGLGFQLKSLELREKMFEEGNSFVTDRSPVDNAMYFMLQVAPFISTEQTRAFLQKCAHALSKASNLIIIPYNPKQQEFADDGFRNQNAFYQMSADLLINNLLMGSSLSLNNFIHDKETGEKYKTIKALVLPMWEIEIRKVEVLKFLTGIESPLSIRR